jgi:hypothetical protein
LFTLMAQQRQIIIFASEISNMSLVGEAYDRAYLLCLPTFLFLCEISVYISVMHWGSPIVTTVEETLGVLQNPSSSSLHIVSSLVPHAPSDAARIFMPPPSPRQRVHNRSKPPLLQVVKMPRCNLPNSYPFICPRNTVWPWFSSFLTFRNPLYFVMWWVCFSMDHQSNNGFCRPSLVMHIVLHRFMRRPSDASHIHAPRTSLEEPHLIAHATPSDAHKFMPRTSLEEPHRCPPCATFCPNFCCPQSQCSH